jgi:hypothetical protein
MFLSSPLDFPYARITYLCMSGLSDSVSRESRHGLLDDTGIILASIGIQK